MAPFGDFLSIPSSLRIHDLVPLVPSITRWDLANASTRVIHRNSILTKKMTKALFQKRWTPHLEMIQRTCKNRCEYLLPTPTPQFCGLAFLGFLYPPGNGSSISHQTGIRKIIFKQTWVTGDVWVPWRVYTYHIYVYIYISYIWYILKKKSHRKASRNMERSHTVPCPRHVRTYDSPVAKATLSPKGASMAKVEPNRKKPVVGGEGCFVPWGMGRDF